MSAQALHPVAAAALCNDIAAFINAETAAAQEGADPAGTDADAAAPAAAADDGDAAGGQTEATCSLSAAKEALRSRLEAYFRETISSVTTPVADADATKAADGGQGGDGGEI